MFRIKEESNGWQVEERFGGENKVYSFKLDEEYNYFNQGRDTFSLYNCTK